eukprot:gnl/TRDRNA2_/TRDRNA2_174456_c1_seq2.p1 gnl/TRDRNA2_/TRDRNA2_174456_c1~~gnl/TRDRNA2_/TRDRNA2_174456_c1_seq2.p1  ORF type:complete len:696 (+),score=111.19 gnl/TRDRNA2_/TRDRNA2_174456_c1_seq2:66-2153(+)
MPDPPPIQRSLGWKDIKLKIATTGEELIVPVMTASKVMDLKQMLGEMIGKEDWMRIELSYKNGPTWKRHRNSDEVCCNLIVRGIDSFARQLQQYPHPWVLIGCGSIGLRVAVMWMKKGINFVNFERKDGLGGNAWRTIANWTSKLQSEGPQYELEYGDCSIDEVPENHCYNDDPRMLDLAQKYWPSKACILKHLNDRADALGLWTNIRLNTEVVDMDIFEVQTSSYGDQKRFDLHWKSTKEDDSTRGVTTASCLAFFPGCLCVPHRNIWPGEDISEMQIGYGFSNEFDYTALTRQKCIIIGMGAFGIENIRTAMEHGAAKIYMICRHFNLLMPRVLAWWINQCTGEHPPTAAMMLDAMKPMYDLVGWDPWNFFSVSANADRSVANIKQYTRWGIGDAAFIAVYYDRCEIIESEVKRFKPKTVVLSTGRILEDVDHVIKVLGFDCDFGVDRIMKTDYHIGHWPNGDWRRYVCSDMSAIDASRFAGVGLSPWARSVANATMWFFQHPADGIRIIESGVMAPNYPIPEKGSAAYHYDPRSGAAVEITQIGMVPELQAFEANNGRWKRDQFLKVASPQKYTDALKADWYGYCKMFQERDGDNRPWPTYPWTSEDLQQLSEKEMELGEAREAARRANYVAAESRGEKPSYSPGSSLSFEAARQVMKIRARSPNSKATAEEQEAGRQAISWLKENAVVGIR